MYKESFHPVTGELFAVNECTCEIDPAKRYLYGPLECPVVDDGEWFADEDVKRSVIHDGPPQEAVGVR
jgi:hypothetical protein